MDESENNNKPKQRDRRWKQHRPGNRPRPGRGDNPDKPVEAQAATPAAASDAEPQHKAPVRQDRQNKPRPHNNNPQRNKPGTQDNSAHAGNANVKEASAQKPDAPRKGIQQPQSAQKSQQQRPQKQIQNGGKQQDNRQPQKKNNVQNNPQGNVQGKAQSNNQNKAPVRAQSSDRNQLQNTAVESNVQNNTQQNPAQSDVQSYTQSITQSYKNRNKHFGSESGFMSATDSLSSDTDQKQNYTQPTEIAGPEVLEDIPKFSRAAIGSNNTEEKEKVEIVGVQFKSVGKVYYFDPGELKFNVGAQVIVETVRGIEFGEIAMDNKLVSSSGVIFPLRPVVRAATPEDIEHNAENISKEEEAFRVCAQKIINHKLDMKLVDAQYTFDNTKLLFYFTSAGRVDFRDLVKDLAGVFRTRIELRQIGIRDEAKMIGGLGACGRPLCCAGFLSDFVQVSIKMAKEQGLSLNSNKISGCCGRLMCCLRYEYDAYVEELKQLPSTDSRVTTPDGQGTVTDVYPLMGTVKVRIDGQDPVFRIYNKELVKLITQPAVPPVRNVTNEPVNGTDTQDIKE